MNDKKRIEEKLQMLHDWSNGVYKYIDKELLIDKLEKGGFIEINRLYDLGYRKIDKDAIVLNKYEYEQICQEILAATEDKQFARKEIAREIIHYIDTEIRNYINDSDLRLFNGDIKWLKEQCGIEVEE